MNPRQILGHTLAPFAITLAIFALWVALLAIPGAAPLVEIFIELASETIGLAGVLIVASVIVLLFCCHHWISGVAMLCGLIVVALLATAPTMPRSAARMTASLVQLLYWRGDLLRQAEELKRQGKSPTVAVITLNGRGGSSSGLALDPTGEILLPPNKRSSSWNATTAQTDLVFLNLKPHHLVGDYYAWFHH